MQDEFKMGVVHARGPEDGARSEEGPPHITPLALFRVVTVQDAVTKLYSCVVRST